MSNFIGPEDSELWASQQQLSHNIAPKIPAAASQSSLALPLSTTYPLSEKGPAYRKRHDPRKKRLTIMISGCVGSGKAKLAHILVGLFSTATSSLSGDPSVESNSNDKATTKVILIHQEDFTLPAQYCPQARWFEHSPPIYAGDNPEDADLNDSYWAHAFEANIGVEPTFIENKYSWIPLPRVASKVGSNMDCRMAVDWVDFLMKANSGMMGTDDNEGMMATEQGRQIVQDCMDKLDVSFVDRLRNMIRRFIVDQTAQNAKCGFKGRAVVDGAIRDIFIMEGPLLLLLGDGSEDLMDHCDMKIFLPTSRGVAMRRRLHRLEWMGEELVGDKDGNARVTEGYFTGVAWPEYFREHQWLTLGGDLENPSANPSPWCWRKSVTVRPELDSNIKTTVYYAVEMILAKLAVEEQTARVDFFLSLWRDDPNHPVLGRVPVDDEDHRASQDTAEDCVASSAERVERFASSPGTGVRSSSSDNQTAPKGPLRFEAIKRDEGSGSGSSNKIRLTRKPAPVEVAPSSSSLPPAASVEFQRAVDRHHSNFEFNAVEFMKAPPKYQNDAMDLSSSPTARFSKPQNVEDAMIDNDFDSPPPQMMQGVYPYNYSMTHYNRTELPRTPGPVARPLQSFYPMIPPLISHHGGAQLPASKLINTRPPAAGQPAFSDPFDQSRPQRPQGVSQMEELIDPKLREMEHLDAFKKPSGATRALSLTEALRRRNGEAR